MRAFLPAAILIALMCLATSTQTYAGAIPNVSPTVETDPVPGIGDAADDPAIWVHPVDPSLSLIIGTDKKSGLAVYDLAGHQLQFLPDGKMNNVDLRYNFPLGGQLIDLVTAGNTSTDSIAIYKVNQATRQLENVAARVFDVGIGVYGSSMYHSPITGKYYFFVNSKYGEVQQWELFDNGQGKVDATLVRSFDVGLQVEGSVADDELGHFYIAEEQVGIWKYSAEPDVTNDHFLIDQTGLNGHLTADVEGLTIYYTHDGSGYLLASSQGSSTFVIYQRTGNNPYVATFEITAANGIDGVTKTDGIDVSNVNLGPLFPQGVFVVQDTNNYPSNQNYKLIPWESIANIVTPALVIDTAWDPRVPGNVTPSPVPIPGPSPIPDPRRWIFFPIIRR